VSDEKEPVPDVPRDDDGAYVIEDTNESLANFSTNGEEQHADPAEAKPAEAVVVLEGEIAKCQQENEQLRNQFLRSRADLENFRRRAEREKNDYYKFALTELVRDLLPVLDNLERALGARAESDDLRKGVELIYKQLSDALAKYGLKAIDAAPVVFDPTIHEAVTREENTAFPSHTVIEILQRGYFLNDRLIRPAMVRVAVDVDESGSVH
jgi:molecular chaperone GrpE